MSGKRSILNQLHRAIRILMEDSYMRPQLTLAEVLNMEVLNNQLNICEPQMPVYSKKVVR